MPVSVDLAVELLTKANHSFVPTPALHTLGDLDLPSAYRVQELVYADLYGDPRRPGGYKISLVAPEHRAAFGASEPTYGRLPEAHLIQGSPTIDMTSLHCPLVEPELVFILDEDLPPNATPDQVRRASRVAAGLEIPDSRYVGWFPVPNQTVGDLVADNSFAGLVVYDDHVVPAAELDLAGVTVTMTVDGELFGTGHGAQVMGDPANAVAWLSAALARDGVILTAGTRVAAGTFLWPPPARPGSSFQAEYTGIGSVTARFT